MAKYIDIANTLKVRIRRGKYSNKLPSTHELAKEFGVNPNTIQRVLELMKKQGYAYGVNGKGFYISQRSIKTSCDSLTVYVTDKFFNPNPFYPNYLSHLRKTLQRHNISLEVLFAGQYPDYRNTLGIILIEGPFLSEQLLELRRHVPPEHIWFMNYFADGIQTIGNDNYAGGKLAMQYLYDKGHRRIAAMFFGKDEPWGIHFERMRGFREQASALGISLRICHQSTEPNQQELNCMLDELIHGSDAPSAIFTATDLKAIQTMNYLHEHSIAVPEDISILGYDNLSLTNFFHPPLTTIEEPAIELAELTVEHVMHPPQTFTPAQYLLPPNLIERCSVANR